MNNDKTEVECYLICILKSDGQAQRNRGVSFPVGKQHLQRLGGLELTLFGNLRDQDYSAVGA